MAVFDTSSRVCLHSLETTDAELAADTWRLVSGTFLCQAVVAEQWVNYGRPPGPGSLMAIGQAYWLARDLRADTMSRPEVIRALGMSGSVGKSAVWGEVQRQLGSDQQGKRCSKRKNKSHSPACELCQGTGWQRQPGPLAHVKGHARDALGLALAWAIEKGVL